MSADLTDQNSLKDDVKNAQDRVPKMHVERKQRG